MVSLERQLTGFLHLLRQTGGGAEYIGQSGPIRIDMLTARSHTHKRIHLSVYLHITLTAPGRSIFTIVANCICRPGYEPFTCVRPNVESLEAYTCLKVTTATSKGCFYHRCCKHAGEISLKRFSKGHNTDTRPTHNFPIMN